MALPSSSLPFSTATIPHASAFSSRAPSLVACSAKQIRGCTSQLKVLACKPTSQGQMPRRLRRKRRLRKEDPVSVSHRSENYWDPHLERQVRRMREQGNHINYDVERLKLQHENKFELILELADEANKFLINHPEEAIIKKPGLKAISNAVNESGLGQVADSYLDATFEFLEDLGRFNMY